MRTNRRLDSGFTLVEIMIVVAIISLLTVIAIPNFVRARTTTQRNACINNLRQIFGVKQQWALEYKAGTNATPTLADVTSYLKQPLVCPAGGSSATFSSSYNMNDVGTRPTCKVVAEEHTLTEDTTN